MKFSVIDFGETSQSYKEELIRTCAVCPECGSYGDDLSFSFHSSNKSGILYDKYYIYATIKCKECSCTFRSESIITDKKNVPLGRRVHNLTLIISLVLFVFSIICLVLVVFGHEPIIFSLLFAVSFIMSVLLMILLCFMY